MDLILTGLCYRTVVTHVYSQIIYINVAEFATYSGRWQYEMRMLPLV
jgi:hypothetical protein